MVAKLAAQKRKAWLSGKAREWNLAPANTRLRRKLSEEESLVLYAVNLNGPAVSFVEVTNLQEAMVLLDNGRPTHILTQGKGAKLSWPPMGVRVAFSPKEKGVALYQFDTYSMRMRGKSPLVTQKVLPPSPKFLPTGAGKTSSVLRIANGTGQMMSVWLKYRYFAGPAKGWVWKKEGPINIKRQTNYTVKVKDKAVYIDAYYLFGQAKNGFRTYGSWDRLVRIKDKMISPALASHTLE